MEGLFARLTEYGASQYYPFLMPGHKGTCRSWVALQGIAGLDITEIEGFDDLHAPDGILKEAQGKGSGCFFGAEEGNFPGKWFYGVGSLLRFRRRRQGAAGLSWRGTAINPCIMPASCGSWSLFFFIRGRCRITGYGLYPPEQGGKRP